MLSNLIVVVRFCTFPHLIIHNFFNCTNQGCCFLKLAKFKQLRALVSCQLSMDVDVELLSVNLCLTFLKFAPYI